MKNKPAKVVIDVTDPSVAAHQSRFSPEGIVVKISGTDPFTDATTREPVEVTSFVDIAVSGSLTVRDAPGFEGSNKTFMDSMRRKAAQPAKRLTAREAAAVAISKWKALNK